MANIKHGKRNHRLYNVYKNMIDRCYNKNSLYYRNYGGRGITVCERWHNITNFIEDMESLFEEGLQIDREDNNGNYCLENCRWVTRKVNCGNTRKNVTYKGETLTDASIRLKGNRSLVHNRIHLGWSKERAFTEAKKSPRNRGL